MSVCNHCGKSYFPGHYCVPLEKKIKNAAQQKGEGVEQKVLNSMSINSFLTGLKGMIKTGEYKTVKFSVALSDKEPASQGGPDKPKQQAQLSIVELSKFFKEEFGGSDSQNSAINKFVEYVQKQQMH